MQFSEYARQAGLTPTQELVAEMWLDGASKSKIASALSLTRLDVSRALREATEALALVVPEFWEEGNEFPRSLVRAVANRADHRDGNLSGVSPAYDVATHLPKAAVFPADRREIRQTHEWCLRWWARSVSAPASP